MDTVKWRLKNYLEEHNLTAYALVRASGLAPGTVYAAARGEQNQIRLDTLAGVLSGLRELTKSDVALTDVLEHGVAPDPVPDEQDELLAATTADLSADLDGLEGDLPAGEVDAWLETFYSAADGR